MSSKRMDTEDTSKSGDFSHTKSLDIFDVLRVEEVCSPVRERNESEH